MVWAIIKVAPDGVFALEMILESAADKDVAVSLREKLRPLIPVINEAVQMENNEAATH